MRRIFDSFLTSHIHDEGHRSQLIELTNSQKQEIAESGVLMGSALIKLLDRAQEDLKKNDIDGYLAKLQRAEIICEAMRKIF